MPRVGFEPTIPVFEWPKIVRVSDMIHYHVLVKHINWLTHSETKESKWSVKGINFPL
jgi:hypothetical protein